MSALAGFNLMLDHVRLRLARFGLPAKTIRLVVNTWRDVLLERTKRVGRAHWPRVGVFVIKKSKARRVFNIGMVGPEETVLLPPSWTLSLKASKHAKGRG